jgi:uncharacterized protein
MMAIKPGDVLINQMQEPTPPNTHAQQIAAQLSLPIPKVAATIDLLTAGNTLPFIARYRKEATGGLDEEQIAAIMAALATLQALDERRATVLAAIAEQGKLTPELQAQIEQAATRTELEDLYAPYKQKRRTRASVARELGLQPLADLILSQARRPAPDEAAPGYLRDELPTVEAVLAGARDIVAEAVSDHAEVRRVVREKARKFAAISASRVPGSADERGVYQTLLRLHPAHRPAASAPGAGAQPRRGAEGAARQPGGPGARLAQRHHCGLPQRPALALGDALD